jgi:hypothetical protein
LKTARSVTKTTSWPRRTASAPAGSGVELHLFGNDDDVEQVAGDANGARVQRARLDDLLDLADDNAAVVVRRLRHRQRVEIADFVFHADVAVHLGGVPCMKATSIGLVWRR